MFRKTKDDRVNMYLREKVKQAGIEASESQEDMAFILQKSRVAVSDLERSRVSVSASDLAMSARHYEKPISNCFHRGVSIDKSEFNPLEEELFFLYSQLSTTQKHMAIEYYKQQVEITNRVHDRQ